MNMLEIIQTLLFAFNIMLVLRIVMLNSWYWRSKACQQECWIVDVL